MLNNTGFSWKGHTMFTDGSKATTKFNVSLIKYPEGRAGPLWYAVSQCSFKKYFHANHATKFDLFLGQAY